MKMAKAKDSHVCLLAEPFGGGVVGAEADLAKYNGMAHGNRAFLPMDVIYVVAELNEVGREDECVIPGMSPSPRLAPTPPHANR